MKYESRYSFGDRVEFTPTAKQAKELNIYEEEMYGIITSVRFTPAKCWYEILDDYHGEVFLVPSHNIKEKVELQ